jgi:carboxymethylenebutenolidase
VLLRASDGHQVQAYRVSPTGDAIGSLVVLQEIFGVNQHIREVCDGFAAKGYSVVAPALFDRVQPGVQLGYDKNSIETGRALRAAIDWDDSLRDVQAAITEVRQDHPVGVVGYCWGGTLAFLAAARLEGVGCAVGYYGGQTIPFVHEKPRVPVLLHFGELDPRIPASDRDAIRHHHPDIEMHLFPADHGFNCDHRKEWHPASAAKALEITLAFLQRHLVASPRREP